MLLRLALLLFAAWVVYRLFFQKPRSTPTKASPARYRDTVKCAACGVHLPSDKAVRRGDSWYCSAEHAAGPDPR